MIDLNDNNKMWLIHIQMVNDINSSIQMLRVNNYMLSYSEVLKQDETHNIHYEIYFITIFKVLKKLKNSPYEKMLGKT